MQFSSIPFYCGIAPLGVFLFSDTPYGPVLLVAVLPDRVDTSQISAILFYMKYVILFCFMLLNKTDEY